VEPFEEWYPWSMITTSLDYLPRGRVRVDLDEIFATAGVGAHRLAIQGQFTASWLDQESDGAATPALLTGTVDVSTRGQRWLGGLQPLVVTLRGFPVHRDLLLSVSDEQVVALDRARADGDLHFVVTLQMTLLEPPGAVHPVGDTQVTLPVSRARWLELLDQLGIEIAISIRVPSPLDATHSLGPTDESGEASLSRTVARLRAARGQLREHQWEAAVASCRLALEGVVGLARPLPSEPSVRAVIPRERTSEQRWASLYYGARSLASAALHDDEVTADFAWSRTDVEGLLAMTAALVNHYLAEQ
jgi:hypothetical protein